LCGADLIAGWYAKEEGKEAKAPCVICGDSHTIYTDSGGEHPCPCVPTGHVEIVGPDGTVHYRGPCWHETVKETLDAEGYTIRPWHNCPDV
jgi:hypothetical protein